MAYTYDDFVTAAQSAGMLEGFDAEDLARAQTNPEFGLSLVKLRQDAANATTPEQKLLAEQAQTQLRKVYSGTAGSNPAVQSSGTMEGFTFDREQQIRDLTDKAVNTAPFRYDPATDPAAAAARKQYLREAERSREDTMARAAAGTGGTPSSFAVTAAQQAGDYHLTQLADRQGQLEETAYQRYLNDHQKTLSDLALLQGQKDKEYAMYLDQAQRDKEALEGALSLYETYKGVMPVDQMLNLISAAGYMTPQIQAVFGRIQQLEQAQKAAAAAGGSGIWYDGGPTGDGMWLSEEEALYLSDELDTLERLRRTFQRQAQGQINYGDDVMETNGGTKPSGAGVNKNQFK